METRPYVFSYTCELVLYFSCFTVSLKMQNWWAWESKIGGLEKSTGMQNLSPSPLICIFSTQMSLTPLSAILLSKASSLPLSTSSYFFFFNFQSGVLIITEPLKKDLGLLEQCSTVTWMKGPSVLCLRGTERALEMCRSVASSLWMCLNLPSICKNLPQMEVLGENALS